MKIERTIIHYLGDVFSAVADLGSLSPYCLTCIQDLCGEFKNTKTKNTLKYYYPYNYFNQAKCNFTLTNIYLSLDFFETSKT